MGAIRHLAAAAVLVLATVSASSGFAEDGAPRRSASLALPVGNGSLSVAGNMVPDAGGFPEARLTKPATTRAAIVEPVSGPAREAIRPAPAVSLDRRVPAAQVTDREGLSLVGLVAVVGELRHAFSPGEADRSRDEGLARVMRTVRDSVFGKRISILSESGRIVENDPFLVGVSFTH